MLIRQRAELNAREQVSRIAHEAAGRKILEGAVHGLSSASAVSENENPKPNRRGELERERVPPEARQVHVEQPRRCAYSFGHSYPLVLGR